MRNFLIIIFILVGVNLAISLALFSELKVAPSIQIIKEHTITQLAPEEAAPKPKEIEPIKSQITSATEDAPKPLETPSEEKPAGKDWKGCSIVPFVDITEITDLTMGEIAGTDEDSAVDEIVKDTMNCANECKQLNKCTRGGAIDSDRNCWCATDVIWEGERGHHFGSLITNMVEEIKEQK